MAHDKICHLPHCPGDQCLDNPCPRIAVRFVERDRRFADALGGYAQAIRQRTDHQMGCRVFAASFYESVATRQAAAICANDADRNPSASEVNVVFCQINRDSKSLRSKPAIVARRHSDVLTKPPGEMALIYKSCRMRDF
jgi:hypothetical protein